MTGPERHANTVRDAIWRAPGHVHESSLTALDALVALAERADTLERERDDLRFWNNRVRVCENHTDEVAAPADDCLVCELTEARGEADRLREALRVATRGCNGTWHCGAVFHVHGCHSDHGLCDEPHEHAALAGPTKAGVPAVPCVDCTHDYCRCAALAGPQTKEQT